MSNPYASPKEESLHYGQDGPSSTAGCLFVFTLMFIGWFIGMSTGLWVLFYLSM